MTQESVQYSLLGMTCLSCADSAEKVLKNQPGVADVRVHFATQSVEIEYDSDATAFPKLEKAVKSLGFTLVADRKEAERAALDFLKQLKIKLFVAGVFASAVVVLAMFVPHFAGSEWLQLALTLPVMFYSGLSFFTGAWKQAVNRSVSMDTLVAVGVGSAFALSVWLNLSGGGAHHLYFESAAVIITFILLGKYLEETARFSSNRAVDQLVEMTPAFAHKITEAGVTETPIAEIKTGDRLEIRPKERIPVDGVVVSGLSYIDESMISGEPIPVAKTVNDSLTAGTLNQSGVLTVRATQVGGETTLAKIIKQVETAQAGKAPAQRLADKIVAVFVPIIFVLAALSFAGWWIVSGDFWKAMETALTVLVISCPCALGLATPIAMKVAINRALKMGVLIKTATAIEDAAVVDLIVFDKTGTLTEGRPAVARAEWQPAADSEANRKAVFAALRQSQHPLSKAVAEYLKPNETTPDAETFTETAGKGVAATANGKRILAGSEALLRENSVVLPQKQDDLSGASYVWLAADGEYLGRMAVTDAIKASAKETLNKIHELGIETIMLTGDTEANAKIVSESVGLQQYKTRLAPEDKSKYIQEQRAAGKKVAMLGDGVNDAIAFAQSDVSIAMSDGSAIAIESAQIALLRGDLALLPPFFRLARRTVAVTKQNLFWAFFYNIIALPLAMGLVPGVVIDPMVAGAAMAFSSLSVVLNSLRLRG